MKLLAFAAAFAAAAPAAASASDRADLAVERGSVHFAQGRLSGSFTVVDRGRAVGRSSAALVIRVAGRQRVVARFTVPALGRGERRRISVRGKLPTGLPVGARAIRACADSSARVRERSEANNCLKVAALLISARPKAPVPPPPATAPLPSGPAGPPPVAPYASSVPSAPIAFTKDQIFTLQSPLTPYYVYVPAAYDASNSTPITLFVWLHGCQEYSPREIASISPGGAQSWISISVGGREGTCWDVNADTPKVLAAIADAKRHFNVNPRRVILGGFSSGGDLAYRVAYYNANLFAGLLAEGTEPFRDTGCAGQQACISAAAWKFNIVHLAHLQDLSYPIDEVRAETDALKAAGFPLTRIERAGGHSEPDGDHTGTIYDRRMDLLPHLQDPWLAPSG